jgi:hypothetical protein
MALHPPGKPIENAYIESFNARFRDECLNENWFIDLADARQNIEDWRQDYNQQRPHSALDYRTPEEFAKLAGSSYGIDIGRRSLAFPVAPPCVRVRTRRFGRIRRPVCSARKEVASDRSMRQA